MSPAAFADLARLCGLPSQPDVLARLGKDGTVPVATVSGRSTYTVAHLALLWMYQRAVTVCLHPWAGETTGTEPTPAAIAAAVERVREWGDPFRAWLGSGHFDDAWWRELTAEVRAHHPLGEAHTLGPVMAADVLGTVRGELRAFLELDRFLAALWQLVEDCRRDGEPPPAPTTLVERFGFERSLAETSTANDSGGLPASAFYAEGEGSGEDIEDDPHASGTWRFLQLAASGQYADTTPASEQARRAAAETSALIALSNTHEVRGETQSIRLTEFEARERDLFEQEAWEELAEHYRASLDLFESDEPVGRVLKKLALIHLEKLGRTEEGIELFLRALERVPTDRSGLQSVDRLLRNESRWQELATIWQRTATKSSGPKSSEAWARVAYILLKELDNLPESVRALRFALEADPDNRSARQALTELLTVPAEERSGPHLLETAEEWAKLADMAQRWATRMDDDEEAAQWSRRAAELYVTAGDRVDEALECLEAALTRDPQHIEAYHRLESLARHHQRWDDFSAILTRLLERELARDNALALTLLAELLRERARTVDEVDRVYERLIDSFPEAIPSADADQSREDEDAPSTDDEGPE